MNFYSGILGDECIILGSKGAQTSLGAYLIKEIQTLINPVLHSYF